MYNGEDIIKEEDCDPNGLLFWAHSYGLIKQVFDIPIGVWRLDK